MIRDKDRLMRELDGQALPFGFEQIAVMNFEVGNINDFRIESCPRYCAEYLKQLYDLSNFSQYSDMVEQLRDPI